MNRKNKVVTEWKEYMSTQLVLVHHNFAEFKIFPYFPLISFLIFLKWIFTYISSFTHKRIFHQMLFLKQGFLSVSISSDPFSKSFSVLSLFRKPDDESLFQSNICTTRDKYHHDCFLFGRLQFILHIYIYIYIGR